MSRLVLIADGDAHRAERIAEACAVRGFATRTAAHGPAALEAALAEVPNVLVVAAELGLLPPRKLAEILRANPRTQAVSIVCVGRAAGDAAPEEWGAEPLPAAAGPDEVARMVERLVARSSRLDALEREAVGEDEVQGRLGQIPLADLLQLFHLNRRSGTLEIRRRSPEGREERGRVHVRDGDVIQASVGPVEGEKALFRLLGWTDGVFAFRAGGVDVAPRIEMPTRALLMEGMRQLDEWGRHGSALPSLDAHVALRVRSDELPSVVQPLTQEVLLLLEIYTRVRDVVDRCSFPDYQVLRTLQTLVERGVVELREAPPAPPAPSGIFGAAQVRRLREWLAAGRGRLGGPRDAKLLLVAPDPGTSASFVKLLRALPGMQLARRFLDGRFSAGDLAPIGRLPVADGLGIEILHVPVDPRFAPLWPLAGHGSLGTLLLTPERPDHEAHDALHPVVEALRALPRARLFHVWLLRRGEKEKGLSQEIRRNLALLDDSSLFLLPVDGGKDPTHLLGSAFARILP